MYDIDYEVYKFINELVDKYVETDELIRRNGVTFDEALKQAAQFKEKFYSLLEKYIINSQSLVVLCYELAEYIEQQPDNPDLQYLYLCVMTDFGLLNQINANDRTEEQKIRNYIRQNELIQELTKFREAQSICLEKYQKLLQYLKKPTKVKSVDYSEDSEALYHLTIQHTFLHDSIKNDVYQDNLNALLIHIESDEKLNPVKPYIIFAVLARKTGMMQKRKHFIPNLKAVFQYQEYNILKDNGKNFNQYLSELELYYHLKISYLDDEEVDMELCDFCFANLSPLSEWYYRNCKPNEDFPMTLRRKIQTIMPKSFPYIISYADYEKLEEDEILIYGDAAAELKEKMLQVAEKFLKL